MNTLTTYLSSEVSKRFLSFILISGLLVTQLLPVGVFAQEASEAGGESGGSETTSASADTQADTEIETGDATAATDVSTEANTNVTDTNANGGSEAAETLASEAGEEEAATESDEETTNESDNTTKEEVHSVEAGADDEMSQAESSGEVTDTSESENASTAGYANATTTEEATDTTEENTEENTETHTASSTESSTTESEHEWEENADGSSSSSARAATSTSTEAAESHTEEAVLSEAAGSGGATAASSNAHAATSSTTANQQEAHAASSTPVKNTASTTIQSENDGRIINAASSSAATGNNAAENQGGGVSIETGTAISAVNLVNVLNTNIINSEGLLLFLNNLFGPIGTIDLREQLLAAMQGGSAPTSSCSFALCGASNTLFQSVSSSTAKIYNDVIVRADSSGNVASSSASHARIATGDAIAAANIANVANTNIIDSNYLLLSVNNIGSFAGDLVLPGASFFENLFFGNRSVGGRQVDVESNNTAGILNNVGLTADSGGNEATSTNGTAKIASGAADVHTNIFNSVNQNLFGANSFMILVRVAGDWAGNVFSAPPGLMWAETDGSVMLWNEGAAGVSTAAQSAAGVAKGLSGNVFNAVQNNTAEIVNNIQVTALTGANRAFSESADALISTGRASASANIFNLANTNVIGSNMVLALITIGGDWTGNIAFGRPDIWVGGAVKAPHNPILPGDEITYTFTVANRGDADATNAHLSIRLPEAFMQFTDGFNAGNGDVFWPIGNLRAGTVREIEVTGHATDAMGQGVHYMDMQATVTSYEPDNNTHDNTEHFSLVAANYPKYDPYANVDYAPYPELVISKTNSQSTIIAGESVDYSITINNEGFGPSYHTILVDRLTNSDGEVIFEESWNLDTIARGEEVTVDYTIQFDAETQPDVYTNSARIEAYAGSPILEPMYGSPIFTQYVSTTVTVLTTEEDPEPTVEGIGGIGGSNEPEDTVEEEIAITVSQEESAPTEPEEEELAAALVPASTQSATEAPLPPIQGPEPIARRSAPVVLAAADSFSGTSGMGGSNIAAAVLAAFSNTATSALLLIAGIGTAILMFFRRERGGV